MVRVTILFSITLCFACSRDYNCKPGLPRKFHTVPLTHGSDVSYQHYIELNGLSKRCDSAIVMSAINEYIDSNRSETSVSSIAIFNSAENFDRSESAGQPKELYGDCVVEIWLEEPIRFVFYDDNGNVTYQGRQWMR